MKLKEIKPGMAIRCHNFEQGEAVVKQLNRQGAGLGHYSPHYTDEHCVVYFNFDNQYSFWNEYDATCEFSDLILPELTAEEVVEWLCKHYTDGEYDRAFKGDFVLGELLERFTPEDIVKNIAKWKADHEKKEPEIETVDICRIIEIQPDGRKRCVHEEDIVSEFPFGGDERQKWKKPRNIFVCSMADMFGKWVSDEWIGEVFEACDKAPQHNYLFLTKNPKRYEQIDNKTILPLCENFWYGTTLVTPNSQCFLSNVHNTFWSIEPILAPFHNSIWREDKNNSSPSWIIVGAETGRRKDKVIPERKWIEDIMEQCREAEIPVFMKSSLAEIWGEPLIQEFPEQLIHKK